MAVVPESNFSLVLFNSPAFLIIILFSQNPLRHAFLFWSVICIVYFQMSTSPDYSKVLEALKVINQMVYIWDKVFKNKWTK